jgi:hypothetical protein
MFRSIVRPTMREVEIMSNMAYLNCLGKPSGGPGWSFPRSGLREGGILAIDPRDGKVFPNDIREIMNAVNNESILIVGLIDRTTEGI